MRPGAVALLWFPYSRQELVPFKKRPVLVLGQSKTQSGADSAVLIAMITGSKQRVQNPGLADFVLDSWAAYGLLAPSVVRTTRLWTAESRDFEKPIGAIDNPTLNLVIDQIKDQFPILSR